MKFLTTPSAANASATPPQRGLTQKRRKLDKIPLWGGVPVRAGWSLTEKI